MTAASTTTYADLLAPERVDNLFANWRMRLDTALSPLHAFAGLDEHAALGCIIAGPDACRELLERGLSLLPRVLPLLTPKLFEQDALNLKELAGFVRVVECAGLTPPELPIRDYLPALSAASAQMPEILAPTILHAIGEGDWARAKKLLGSRPPAEFDPAAPFGEPARKFLLELCASAKAGRESAELQRALPQLLEDFPDHTRPLSFPSLQLLLIVRIVKSKLRGEAPGSVARELHEYARSHAS